MTLEDTIRQVVREELRALVDELRPAPAERVPGGYLTIDEAATLARLRPATLRTWIRSGRLRATGRPYRVSREDLAEALESRPAPDEPPKGGAGSILRSL